MDITLKQRLVGVMVLLSLGIIFLPSLFYRDTGERTVVDTQSVIPPKPVVRTIVIRPPNATQQPPAAKPSDAFQPSTEHLLSASSSNSDVDNDKPEASTEPKVSPKAPEKKTIDDNALRIDTSGLPKSWVIQAASFQSKEHAEALMNKLRGKNLKAYVRPVKTSKGQFFRVLIGPYISQSRAETDKVVVDKTYKVKGQILRFSSK
ncbi:SPOR domain-containing protein [Eionea flava]